MQISLETSRRTLDTTEPTEDMEHGTPAAPGIGDVAAYRPWFRTHVQPRRYYPRLHGLVHLGPPLAVCVFAARSLSQVTAWQWLMVPAGLLFGSAFVYWFHRHVLHRRTRWAAFAYERHTLQHHRFFDYEHITLEQPGDWHVTLFPWWAGLVLAALSLAIGTGLDQVGNHNVAMFVMLLLPLYLLLYEGVHSVSHLADEHPLARLVVLRHLREHHRLHHDPTLMGHYNFNIVLPLFDLWCGALKTCQG